MVESQNALQESIKRKGDKSYYYAHAPRNVDDPSIATILEGEGIVAGGHPKLLVKEVSKQEEVKQLVNIRNYAWHDSDDKVVVSMPFEDTEDKVRVTFTKDSLEVIYEVNPTETRKLYLKPLNKSINPDISTYRVRRNKLHIHLAKEDIDETWYNLIKT